MTAETLKFPIDTEQNPVTADLHLFTTYPEHVIAATALHRQVQFVCNDGGSGTVSTDDGEASVSFYDDSNKLPKPIAPISYLIPGLDIEFPLVQCGAIRPHGQPFSYGIFGTIEPGRTRPVPAMTLYHSGMSGDWRTVGRPLAAEHIYTVARLLLGTTIRRR